MKENDNPFRVKKYNESPKGDPRDVYIYTNVFSISKINEAEQTFNAHLYIRASWEATPEESEFSCTS